MKKTLTKDLNGNPLKTKFSNEATFDQIKAENDFLYKKVANLEQTLNNLSTQHENTLHGYHHLHQTNANLFLQVEKLHSKLSAADEENLNLKLIHEQNTSEDITELECKISQQNEEVFDLKNYNRSLKEQIQKLNSELSESKEKFDEEIDELQNKSKIEVKAWKKELGEEMRMKIILEDKLRYAVRRELCHQTMPGQMILLKKT